jgi:hypothetical protein
MTYTRLKCTPSKLSLHLDDLGRKILFHFEFGLLMLNIFNCFIPNDLPFKNISNVLDVYGAFIYIVHHLERMTNNMGQIFGREKHFHVHATLKPFNSHDIITK